MSNFFLFLLIIKNRIISRGIHSTALFRSSLSAVAYHQSCQISQEQFVSAVNRVDTPVEETPPISNFRNSDYFFYVLGPKFNTYLDFTVFPTHPSISQDDVIVSLAHYLLSASLYRSTSRQSHIIVIPHVTSWTTHLRH